MINLIQPITVQQAYDGITHARRWASWNWWWRKVDDDDGDGFPSLEPQTYSRSALPRDIRAWRQLCIVKGDESFSQIFSPRTWIYRVGVEVGGAPGGPHPFHEGGGHAPCLVGPLELHRPQLQLYIFRFAEKKIKEKVSSHFTIQSHCQALISLRRADLECVWGSGEGNLSLMSSSTFLHHQFHDAHHRAWVIPS